MKSAILYATAARPAYKGSGDYVYMDKLHAGEHHRIWVRIEIVNDHIAAALDVAKPRPGETVLNTIPLP